MGVKYGKDVLYSLLGLAIRDVADICQKLAHRINMSAPTVDVDCSNVCFKVGRNAQSVANFLTKWANHGIHMNPVCDGKVRPISNSTCRELLPHHQNCCVVNTHVNAAHRVTRGLFVCIYLLFFI